MPDEIQNNELLYALLPHICKHRSRIDDYFIIGPERKETEEETQKANFYVFHEPKIPIPEPKLDVWAYLDEDAVLSLLNAEKPKLVRRIVVSS
ncbi:unnamed protein product [Callosobruchus maculatus]|uniref:Uncharacterized protein n=1 Tax=Callosobruchus maculatus TaxID=64391 RepID=A0A653CDJ9_CALMS|nr:unnamed protein product [Callosobruchus maculatus]